MDMIELFVGERKLSLEERRLQPRYRGELCIDRYFSWHGHDFAPSIATLRPYGMVEELHKARPVYLLGRDFVLSGEQRVRGRFYNQMWWCKIIAIVPPGEELPGSEPAPSPSAPHQSDQRIQEPADA